MSRSQTHQVDLLHEFVVDAEKEIIVAGRVCAAEAGGAGRADERVKGSNPLQHFREGFWNFYNAPMGSKLDCGKQPACAGSLAAGKSDLDILATGLTCLPIARPFMAKFIVFYVLLAF